MCKVCVQLVCGVWGICWKAFFFAQQILNTIFEHTVYTDFTTHFTHDTHNQNSGAALFKKRFLSTPSTESITTMYIYNNKPVGGLEKELL